MDKIIKIAKNERGATAIITGIMLPVFIGLAAVAVDVGYSMVTRNELQNIADGAALAATGWLGDNYSTMTVTELLNYDVSGDEADIKLIAKAVASQNQAGEVGSIIIADNDIEIGKWDRSITSIDETLRGTVNDPRFTTLQAGEIPDAVRVTARREAGLNGPLNTFFARVFGQDDVGINAIATASLSGIDQVDDCELFWPVGISAAWYDYYNETTGNWCDQDIKMYPTGSMEGCAGWHTFDSWPANASKLRQLLEDIISGDCSDGYKIGDELVFTGGTVASAFDEMEDLWNWGRVHDDGIVDLDYNPATWTTNVVVYGLYDCSNPQGYIEIVGFATVEIYEVLGPPDKIIRATVKRLQYEDGRGRGDEEYGIAGTIPGLVQ